MAGTRKKRQQKRRPNAKRGGRVNGAHRGDPEVIEKTVLRNGQPVAVAQGDELVAKKVKEHRHKLTQDKALAAQLIVAKQAMRKLHQELRASKARIAQLEKELFEAEHTIMDLQDQQLMAEANALRKEHDLPDGWTQLAETEDGWIMDTPIPEDQEPDETNKKPKAEKPKGPTKRDQLLAFAGQRPEEN